MIGPQHGCPECDKQLGWNMEDRYCPQCGQRYRGFDESDRNRHYEETWLSAAGADEDFIEAVRARLKIGAEEYGPDQYKEADCAQEAQEEALDIPGWLVLGSLRLFQDARTMGLSPETVNEIRDRYMEASALAVRAHGEISRARSLLNAATFSTEATGERA